MKKLTVAVLGAGSRGTTYTDIMSDMKDRYQVVAVADPVDSRREHVKTLHQISDENCFTDWKDLLGKGKIADLVLICMQDQMHYEPAMAAIELGYDILLEKPAAPSAIECKRIADAAAQKKVKVVVCHVLRYTSLFGKIKEIIDEGILGDVISINHEENVGNVHQSHSFVRGNWGNEERSANMLLAKSCHDLDLLQWLIGRDVKEVQSFGSLTYFKACNAPDGAPDYCIEGGCPKQDTCPYNAVKLYLDDKKNAWFRTTSTREADPSDEQVEHVLRTTQYGKCVYKCDNDVVDHQTVNMLFEDDITVTFTMNAFNKGGRYIHIFGTKGELRASLNDQSQITVYDFETKVSSVIPYETNDGITSGHGGGDYGIIDTLYAYLTDSYTGRKISDISISAKNHLIAFAAEESRKTHKVVDFAEYCRKI